MDNYQAPARTPAELPTLTPGAADALLFDLGGVVIDIDFERVFAHWAACAGCEVARAVHA